MKRLFPILALLVAGCLERDETITVKPDGSANVVLTCTGDGGDFNDLLVLPEGWKVEKSADKDKTVWTARGSLRDLNAYPNRDANFPYETRLRVTTAGNVRTYDFERTYPQMDARDLIAIDDALWQREEAKALTAKLHDKGMAGLDEPDHTRIFELAAEAEREKQVAVVARALNAMALPWRDRIAALGKVEAEYRARLTWNALRDVVGRNLETVDRYDAYARGLRDRAAALVPGLAAPLEKAATASRAAHAVSDDNFKLTVRLPGRIAAGNATRTDGGEASWEFPGKDLGARPITLRATSVEAIR
jgi:hypothetical protein